MSLKTIGLSQHPGQETYLAELTQPCGSLLERGEPTPNARTRPDLPVGRLALHFTDIQGSTALLHALGEAYPAQLEAHRHILRASFAAHGGVEPANARQRTARCQCQPGARPAAR